MKSAQQRWRRGRAAGGVIALVASVAVAASQPAQAAASSSPLRLRAPLTMTGQEFGGVAYLDDDDAVLQADQTFELWSHRTSYGSAIRTEARIGTRTIELPSGTMDSFAGLPGFLDVTVQKGSGTVVAHRSPTVCLNSYDPQRVVPTGAAHSKYPNDCPTNIFTRGSVQGIAQGWATSLSMFGDNGVKLPVGTYTVDANITAKYRQLFGISARDARVRTKLKITEGDGDNRPIAVPGASPLAAGGRPQRRPSPAAAQPTTHRPTGRRLADTPTSGPRPDLIAVPAWGIEISDKGKYLNFSATVWNGGTSPLVVDGFRRGTSDLMDAYQYFYDQAGDQTGYVPAGTLEWDAAPTHMHWHFSDFAQYRLLDANKKGVERSQKDGFCLANTDAMDYTRPAANWHPDDTDLATACGDHNSLAVSEVLAAGSGDTYEQFRAGQAFSLTGLKNGVYYIAVEANPDHRLTELSTTNNNAYRKIKISGAGKTRKVYVYPYGDVTG